MVQRPNPLQQGDFNYQRDSAWPRNDRSFDIPQDGRFIPAPAPTPVHARSQTIEAALRDCVGIPVKAYALIARLENGEDKVYSSASLADYRGRIFTDPVKDIFRKSIKKSTAAENSFPNSAYSQDGMYNEFDPEASSSGYDRKHSSSGGSSSEYGRRFQRKFEDSDEDESFSSKKRRFPAYRLRENSNDDTPTPVPVRKTQQLMIGDSAMVEKFYQTRFKDMQQSSCKVMGKAFVKLVEPKKQTHHPYTKGDDKAPPWWPNTTGENNVRHKEPDHLLKPERIRLLIHILRMVVEPPQHQHSTVQKLGLNVKKLEEVTMEAMSNWFSDKEHPDNALKKPFLREIFKIARAEERFKNGEIDGTTYFPVMYGERAGTEESDGEGETKLEDDEDDVPTSAISVNMPTPESLISPAIGHNPHVLENDFKMRSNLPMRQGTHPPMEEQQYNDPSNFYHSRGMGFHPQSPNLQDRRSFATPPNYQSPTQNMYGAWPTGMVSNGPGQSFYTTSPQQSLPATTAPYLPPLQQHMLPPPQQQHSNFDGLPGGRYDTSPALGNSLRTGSMGHPHMPGFDNFMHDNVVFQQHDNGLKDESQHLHHSQQ
ncbi:hypothetical protein EG329_008470 [Mollisiaceae sp. DMI_Dod_QoI]|nr:hypothetical protein EG329_008470 [Helotiales sp. DMI_Dod_QoI]